MELLRKCLRCMLCCLSRAMDYLDVCVKILGPVFVLLALALFGFETYTFFVYVLPDLETQGFSEPTLAAVVMIGVFLLCNLVYNYIMAIFVSPGIPPLYGELNLDFLDEEL